MGKPAVTTQGIRSDVHSIHSDLSRRAGRLYKNTRHAGRKSMKYKMSKVRAKKSQSTHAPPRQSKSKTMPALLRQPKSQTVHASPKQPRSQNVPVSPRPTMSKPAPRQSRRPQCKVKLDAANAFRNSLFHHQMKRM